jgi:hypothetical protein
MLRKISTITAMALVLASAACNSISGPADDGGSTGRNSDPVRPSQEVSEKVCIDDLRAVDITSPGESQQLHGGQLAMVTWETREICGGYWADVRVSYDGGQNFVLLGETKNARSMAWRLPELDGVALVVDVTITDSHGSVSDRIALSRELRTRNPNPDRNPDEHD